MGEDEAATVHDLKAHQAVVLPLVGRYGPPDYPDRGGPAAPTAPLDQPHLWPGTATEIAGYGYQTWILPGERRMFLLWGACGERMHVDPRSKLVMVNTAVQEGFDPPALQEIGVLWSALVRQLGGDRP